MSLIGIAERGLVPDRLVRAGIRALLRSRLRSEGRRAGGDRELAVRKLMTRVSDGPVAVSVERANAQHYEVPASFFELVLGHRLKYSSGYWPHGVDTLDGAEDAMLELTCRRAELEDGQRVLELGCGWGSLTLWMAERYPEASITAVSNSSSQRRYIERRAAERGLRNIRVDVCDMNEFEAGERFDRVVSVEMFEHMRNHALLLERISRWLTRDGKLFLHVFCHDRYPYLFEVGEDADWLARHFFTGGMMPSDDLLPRYDRHLEFTEQWKLSGHHYALTAEAWLANLDSRREAVSESLYPVYGGDTGRWIRRWRIFFMACAELFGYRHGDEWRVAHYRAVRRPDNRSAG